MSTLVTTWCSKASLKQRRGRTGRTCHGQCYKMFERRWGADKGRFDMKPGTWWKLMKMIGYWFTDFTSDSCIQYKRILLGWSTAQIYDILSKITTWFRSILSWIKNQQSCIGFVHLPAPMSQTLWPVGGFWPKWCWKILLDKGRGFVATWGCLEGHDSKSSKSWKWTVKPYETFKNERKRGQIEKKESSKILFFSFGWVFVVPFKLPCHHGSQTSRPDRFRWLWKQLI